jgi:ubiquinone/menaquinone biosynthesis C-methylase UbiE
MTHQEFSNAKFWEEKWVQHLEQYLRAAPRMGYWLESHVPSNFKVFEMAGGSCRDSRYLAEKGWDVIGSDFEQSTLNYLEQRFPNSKLPLQCEDAFKLSLSDKSVDLSFHNGFWVLFRDDQKIVELLREQARVTRRILVIAVHNAANIRLIQDFSEKSKSDSLYDIRFFERGELFGLLNSAGISYKRVITHKFGGPVDRLVRGKLRPFTKYVTPMLYNFQSWGVTERIVWLIELDD